MCIRDRVKTIVTMDMGEQIASHYGLRTINVLPGFKFIGEQIGKLEKQGKEMCIRDRFRAQVYEKAKALGFAFPNIVAPSAYISPYAKQMCIRDRNKVTR